MHKEFAKYLVVGGLAFIVDAVVLRIFTELFGAHYLVSAAFGFLAGLLTNYALSVRWVFVKRKGFAPSAEFAIFSLIGAGGLLLTELFMWLFTDIGGLYYMYSKVLTAALVLVWNFGLRKYILFR